MKYHISFKEWNYPDRLNILDQLGIIYKLLNDGNIELLYPLSSGQKEVIEFLINPTYRVDFSLLDKNYGSKLLKLHTKFWEWRFDEIS